MEEIPRQLNNSQSSDSSDFDELQERSNERTRDPRLTEIPPAWIPSSRRWMWPGRLVENDRRHVTTRALQS